MLCREQRPSLRHLHWDMCYLQVLFDARADGRSRNDVREIGCRRGACQSAHGAIQPRNVTTLSSTMWSNSVAAQPRCRPPSVIIYVSPGQQGTERDYLSSRYQTISTMSTNGEQNFEKGNKDYAASFTQGDLALPPSQKYAVGM